MEPDDLELAAHPNRLQPIVAVKGLKLEHNTRVEPAWGKATRPFADATLGRGPFFLYEFGCSGDDLWFCRAVLVISRAAVAARPDGS